MANKTAYQAPISYDETTGKFSQERWAVQLNRDPPRFISMERREPIDQLLKERYGKMIYETRERRKLWTVMQAAGWRLGLIVVTWANLQGEWKRSKSHES